MHGLFGHEGPSYSVNLGQATCQKGKLEKSRNYGLIAAASVSLGCLERVAMKNSAGGVGFLPILRAGKKGIFDRRNKNIGALKNNRYFFDVIVDDDVQPLTALIKFHVWGRAAVDPYLLGSPGYS